MTATSTHINCYKIIICINTSHKYNAETMFLIKVFTSTSIWSLDVNMFIIYGSKHCIICCWHYKRLQGSHKCSSCLCNYNMDSCLPHTKIPCQLLHGTSFG